MTIITNNSSLNTKIPVLAKIDKIDGIHRSIGFE